MSNDNHDIHDTHEEEVFMREDLVDKLTGLYNRKYFEGRLEEEISRSGRYKRPLTVLLFEIDYNHFITDYDIKWGMSYTLLKQFGAFILKTYRNVDLAGRYQGDIFAVILPETPQEGALIAAERLRTAVEKRIFIGDNKLPEIKIAINVGVVVYPQNGLTASELITAAQKALLEAKNSGGNKVALSDHLSREK